MPDQKRVLDVLISMPEYVEAFNKAFQGEKDPVTFDNLANAIGAFERKLVTVSRWDMHLGGDRAALSKAEKAGLNKFLDAGRQSCHNGVRLGGSMFRKLGLAKPWDNAKDPGRFAVTRQEADRMVFKVPALRNIEKTAPLLPRRPDRHDQGGGAPRGRASVGADAAQAGGRLDRDLPEGADRRTPD